LVDAILPVYSVSLKGVFAGRLPRCTQRGRLSSRGGHAQPVPKGKERYLRCSQRV
jgi:hypothetical protein